MPASSDLTGSLDTGGVARRGASRAAIVVARMLLQIACYLQVRGKFYLDLGAEFLDQLDREHSTKRLGRRLEYLGFAIILAKPEITQASSIACYFHINWWDEHFLLCIVG